MILNMNNIGFDNALQQIKQILYSIRPHYTKVYVLGYSIGATLAWLCSQTKLCDLVVGFYMVLRTNFQKTITISQLL